MVMENNYYITEIIAVGTIIVSVVGAFYMTKKQSEDNTKAISLLFRKHDETKIELSTLKDNQNKLLTIKDADDTYVSNKVFQIHINNMEKDVKGLDGKVEKLSDKIDKVLDILSKNCGSCERQ